MTPTLHSNKVLLFNSRRWLPLSDEYIKLFEILNVALYEADIKSNYYNINEQNYMKWSGF